MLTADEWNSPIRTKGLPFFCYGNKFGHREEDLTKPLEIVI